MNTEEIEKMIEELGIQLSKASPQELTPLLGKIHSLKRLLDEIELGIPKK